MAVIPSDQQLLADVVAELERSRPGTTRPLHQQRRLVCGSGSGQGFDQNVRVWRGESLQVALIPGQHQPTTHLHRDGDDMCLSEMI